MIGCLTETSICVAAKALVNIKIHKYVQYPFYLSMFFDINLSKYLSVNDEGADLWGGGLRFPLFALLSYTEF